MVNAQKHRDLLNDTKTRARKQIVRQQLISNNSRKTERLGNHYLYSNGGVSGKNSIVETDEKRAKANQKFISILRDLEA